MPSTPLASKALARCRFRSVSPERQGHPTTGSTAGVTDRPTPPFTAWSSCGCGAISPRSTTSGAARPKERASPRSFAVSSASWSGKSSAICAVQPSPLQPTKMPIDIYRSINAHNHGIYDAVGEIDYRDEGTRNLVKNAARNGIFHPPRPPETSFRNSPTASFYGVTPARATFEVSALPKGAKVEVEAVIALD